MKKSLRFLLTFLLVAVSSVIYAVSYNDKNITVTITLGESVNIDPLKELGIGNDYFCDENSSISQGNFEDVVVQGIRRTITNRHMSGGQWVSGSSGKYYHEYKEYILTPVKSGVYVFSCSIFYNTSTSDTSTDYKTVYLTYTINVVELTSISLPSTTTISVGDSLTFSPVLIDSRATTPLTWSSSNPSVASVDQSGKIQGLKAGTTTINVIASNGVSASCDITVEPIYITKIEMGQAEYKMSQWESLQLTPTFYPANASDKSLTWSSTDESVAIVDDDGTITALGSGMSLIRAKANDGSGKTASCRVTVQKSPQSISLSELPEMKYGDSDFLLPMTTEEGAVISWMSNNAKVVAVNGNILTVKGAGTASIIASQAGDANYSPFTKSFTLSVRKAPLTISADNKKKTAGEENPELTVSYDGFVNNDSEDIFTKQPAISTTATTESDAGEYPITVSGAACANYEITYNAGILTVVKGNQNIGVSVLPVMSYGDSDYILPSSTTEGLPLIWTTDNPDVATIQGNILKVVGAGTANVIADQAGDTNNQAFSKSFPLTVIKASLTILADNKTKSVGEENPQFTIKYTGFVNDETEDDLTQRASASSSATKESKAGDYSIDVSGAVSANYDFRYVTGTLTVSKLEQNINLSELPVMIYGDNDFELPSSTTEGLPLTWTIENTDIASIQGNTLKIHGAGTSKVTAKQTGDENHESFSKTFTLTIMPASLIVIAETKNKSVGEQNPKLTVRYDGFVNGDDESVLISLPKINCDADENSPEGDYDIELSGGLADNYKIKCVNGMMIVKALPSASVIRGDVNEDEKVDISDVVAVINIMAGIGL